MDTPPPEFLLDSDLRNIFPEPIREHRLESLLATQEMAFASVGIRRGQFRVIDVPISQLEWIHTILVPATSPVGRSVFYLTHGFGGTALFYYELAARLREHGEVLLMDLRGMGHSSKYCPPISSSKEIITYFVEAIECVRQYFDHDGLTLVGHSFGSYVTMLYTSFHEKRVLRQVVFSPIGITPKELDYKSHIRSLKDVFQYLLNQLGWRFKLTYKTLLKYFACCWKKAALKSSFRDFGPSESKAQILAEIVLQLYEEPLGSEGLFFRLFEPRVLPTYNLIEHYSHRECSTPTVMAYGETDWVDKQGARQLAEKDPRTFKLRQLKGVGHQILFEQRQGLIDELIDLILNC